MGQQENRSLVDELVELMDKIVGLKLILGFKDLVDGNTEIKRIIKFDQIWRFGSPQLLEKN